MSIFYWSNIFDFVKIYWDKKEYVFLKSKKLEKKKMKKIILFIQCII